VTPKAVQREMEMLQYQNLKLVNPEVSLEDVWRFLDQTELTLRRGGKAEFLPESPLNAANLWVGCRGTLAEEIPAGVLQPVAEVLVDEWGLRPAQAEGMVSLAAQTYTRCCPRLEELEPGQMVWLASRG